MCKKLSNCFLIRKRFAFSSLLLFFNLICFAQQKISVTGNVISDSDKPLASVSIKEKGTEVGTTTNELGNYSFQVNKGAVLIFSFVGYEDQQLKVDKGGTIINIKLVSKTSILNDVVVIGYGTQNKRNLTSATSKVTAKDFKNAVVNTVDQALQGRATGIQVTTTSGEPGANSIIRIRGSNSLSGDNEPLYVIDGVIMPAYKEAASLIYGAFAQNGLYGINPNDIENIEVLKDASATAIFGSRGANGVIVITTKAGKHTEGSIEFVNKTSSGSIGNPLKMMNGKQFAEIYNEYSVNGGNPKPFGNIDTLNTNTNWFDKVTRHTLREDLSLSVSGGTSKSSYYISGNYLNDKGLLFGSDIVRSNIRANLSNVVNNWYTITAQLSFVHQNSHRGISSNGGWPNGPGLLEALRTNPLYHLTDNGLFVKSPIPGGGIGWFGNPVIAQTDKQDLSKNDYSIINIQNLFQLTPDLKLAVNLGRIQNLTRRQAFFPITVNEGFYSNGRGDNSVANTYNYNVNTYLQYDKTIRTNHKLNLTLGAEYIKDQLETLTGSTSGLYLASLGVNNLASAAAQQTLSYKEDRIIESGFFRANYSYKSKYVFNTSIRLDAASPFAENKKSGYFPAVGAAWNINEEKFMKNVTVISNSKIRASYGITGSQAIAPYSSLARYGNDYYQVGSSTQIVVFPFTLGNSNLSWEKTKQFNLGVDFNAWNNRLTFSFDYYKKRTEGLLQPRLLPSQSGNSFITDNYGSISNNGIEFNFQADIIRQTDLKFTTRFNISKNKNILINLGDRKSSSYQSLSGNLQGGVYGILTPGQEIGQFYGFKITGLTQVADFTNGVPNYPFPVTGQVADQRPGNLKYADLDKNGVINNDDRTVLGKSSPDFTYGWTNDFTWKKLGINLFFIGSQGNDILNVTGQYLHRGLISNSGILFNQTDDWFQHRWTPTNPTTNVRFPSTQTNAPTGDINSSMIENGSYFRLKQLSVSYSFGNFKAVKNFRLFVTGTNIFTITKYTGFDPEVSSFGVGLLQQGIDYGAYPSQRSYTIGISANF